MDEEQLQRIEKGFAAGTPLSIYNPHGDRALVDIMVDLESRTIVPALIAEVRSLRAKLDAVPVKAISEFMNRVAFSEEGWPSGYEQERPIIDEWLNDVRVKQTAVQP